MEILLKIYADFNGVEECPEDPKFASLDLTGYGTLASLSLHKLKLKEDMALTLCDSDGLYVNAKIYFDTTRVSENCAGWFAKFKAQDISEGMPMEHDFDRHICFKCSNNLRPYLDVVGQNFNENCPFCGASVLTPLSPPK